MVTRAQIWTNIANAVEVLYDDLLTNTAFVTDFDAYMAALGGTGDRVGAGAEAMRALRARYVDLIRAGRAVIDPHLEDLKEVIDYSFRGIDAEFWRFVRQDMVTQGDAIKSRGITFGAVAAGGSNVGNGTIYRLTEDEHGIDIEAVELDVVTAEVKEDQNTATKVGRELFELRHGNLGLDALEEAGSGRSTTLVGPAGDEGSLLSNASFQSPASSLTAPTSIPDWTWSGTASSELEFDTTETYRSSPEEKASGTAYSLKLKASGTLSQKLSSKNRKVSRLVPYLPGIRYKASSAAGTIQIAHGSHTQSVTPPDTSWNTLLLDRDSDLWYRNWAEDDADFAITWTLSGGNTIKIDDCFWHPGTPFRNLWYWALGGSTHFRRRDILTFTDALAGTDAKVAKILKLLYFEHVRVGTGSAITFADP